MELKKDQLKIVMPEMYGVVSILIIDHNGLIYPVQQIDTLAMEKLKETQGDPLGRPVFYSVKEQVITLHPRCDKDYPKVKLEYLPPKKSL